MFIANVFAPGSSFEDAPIIAASSGNLGKLTEWYRLRIKENIVTIIEMDDDYDPSLDYIAVCEYTDLDR